MKVTLYRLANSADEKSRRYIIDQYEPRLPDFFDPQKDVPEEIEVHVTHGTDRYKYDAVSEPSPGHTRLRILVPDGFQVITVSTSAHEVGVEVEELSDSPIHPQRWRW